jgi:hypothetical protein
MGWAPAPLGGFLTLRRGFLKAPPEEMGRPNIEQGVTNSLTRAQPERRLHVLYCKVKFASP